MDGSEIGRRIGEIVDARIFPGRPPIDNTDQLNRDSDADDRARPCSTSTSSSLTAAPRSRPTNRQHVREVVRRAVSDPAAVLAALGEPQRAGLHKLYQSADLTDAQRGLGADDDGACRTIIKCGR